jgi:hypothetical protein
LLIHEKDNKSICLHDSKDVPIVIRTDLYAGSVAVSAAAGSGFTCALLSSGSIYCWGANSKGQLGNGGHHQGGTTMSGLLPVNFGAYKLMLHVYDSEADVACA